MPRKSPTPYIKHSTHPRKTLLGERLTDLRLHRGLHILTIASLLKVSTPFYSGVETGRVVPKAGSIRKLILAAEQHLDCHIDYWDVAEAYRSKPPNATDARLISVLDRIRKGRGRQDGYLPEAPAVEEPSHPKPVVMTEGERIARLATAFSGPSESPAYPAWDKAQASINRYVLADQAMQAYGLVYQLSKGTLGSVEDEASKHALSQAREVLYGNFMRAAEAYFLFVDTEKDSSNGVSP